MQTHVDVILIAIDIALQAVYTSSKQLSILGAGKPCLSQSQLSL